MPGTSVPIRGLDGTIVRETALPEVFQTPLRGDMIKRAVVVTQSHRFQSQGRDPKAGKRTSAESFGVGRDLSRVPRVKGSRYPRASAAAFAPSTVKGRVTHPPRAAKRVMRKLNKKERRYALRSAIAATGNRALVEGRGHEEVPVLPLVVVDDIENVRTAAEARAAMISLGLWPDVSRVRFSHKAMGRGKRARGKSSKHAIGPLIVVSEDRGIGKAVRSFEGVNVVEVNRLNAELLAPGTHPGRLTMWSESSLKSLQHAEAGNE